MNLKKSVKPRMNTSWVRKGTVAMIVGAMAALVPLAPATAATSEVSAAAIQPPKCIPQDQTSSGFGYTATFKYLGGVYSAGKASYRFSYVAVYSGGVSSSGTTSCTV
jgi:hypothetical protein